MRVQAFDFVLGMPVPVQLHEGRNLCHVHVAGGDPTVERGCSISPKATVLCVYCLQPGSGGYLLPPGSNPLLAASSFFNHPAWVLHPSSGIYKASYMYLSEAQLVGTLVAIFHSRVWYL